MDNNDLFIIFLFAWPLVCICVMYVSRMLKELAESEKNRVKRQRLAEEDRHGG